MKLGKPVSLVIILHFFCFSIALSNAQDRDFTDLAGLLGLGSSAPQIEQEFHLQEDSLLVKQEIDGQENQQYLEDLAERETQPSDVDYDDLPQRDGEDDSRTELPGNGEGGSVPDFPSAVLASNSGKVPSPLDAVSNVGPAALGGAEGNVPETANPRTGAYEFQIPLEVPAGIDGLTPKIALAYSSDASARSSVGAGWSLVGASCISRGSRLLFDAQGHPLFRKGAPSFTDQDIFYLDGEPLLTCPESLSESCPSGTFRTRSNNAAKIEKNGEVAWTVTRKDGSTSYYSRVLEKDGFGVQYCITSQQKNGNFIEYQYEGAGDNSVVLHEISYGGSGSQEQLWTLDFDWESRPDRYESYKAGVRQTFETRLSRIKVEARTTLHTLRSMEVHYEPDLSPITGVSRVHSIQVVGGDGTTMLPPYVFEYNDADDAIGGGVASAWSAAATSDLDTENAFAIYREAPVPCSGGVSDPCWMFGEPFPEVQLANRGLVSVDINGDGFLDLVRHQYEYDEYFHQTLTRIEDFDNLITQLWLGTATGGFEEVVEGHPQYSLVTAIAQMPAFTGNFGLANQDNVEEIVRYQVNQDFGARFADLNGDGRVDLLYSSDDVRLAALWDPTMNNGDGGFNTELASGYTEFLQDRSRSFSLYQIVYDSFDGQGNFNGETVTRHRNEQVAVPTGVALTDVNGDGLVDMIVARLGALPTLRAPEDPSPDEALYRTVYLNTGTTFEPADDPSTPEVEWEITGEFFFARREQRLDSWPACTDIMGDKYCRAYMVSTRGARIADLNGDGLPDIVKMLRSSVLFSGIQGGAPTKCIEHRNVFPNCQRYEPDYNCCTPAEVAAHCQGNPEWNWACGTSYLNSRAGLIRGTVDPEEDTYSYGAWINTGSGWELNEAWTAALQATQPDDVSLDRILHESFGIARSYNQDTGVVLADINGDGLDDIVQSICKQEGHVEGGWLVDDPDTCSLRTFVNKSSSSIVPAFEQQEVFRLPEVLALERLWVDRNAPYETAHGSRSRDWSQHSGVRLVDLNGDGLLDLLQNIEEEGVASRGKYLNSIRFDRDLMASVVVPLGARTELTYAQSAVAAQGSQLPFTKPVVFQVTLNNGRNDNKEWETSRRFHYFGGKILDGSFTGFRVSSVETPLEGSAKRFETKWFLTSEDDYCRLGSLQQSVVSEKLCDGPDGVSGQNCLFSGENFELQLASAQIEALGVYNWSLNSWGVEACPLERTGPFTASQLLPSAVYRITLDPSNPSQQKTLRTEMRYDNFANIVLEELYDELSGLSPIRSVSRNYAPSTDSKWIHNRICEERTSAGTTLKETRSYYYDQNTILCGVISSNGLRTKEIVSGGSDVGGIDTVVSQTSYYSNGQVQSTTDARGHVRSFVYNDPDFPGLLLAEAREPVVPGHPDQIVSYDYDTVGNLETVRNEGDASSCAEERFEYDPLQRLKRRYSATCSGSTSDLPEELYHYVSLGDPHAQYTETIVRTNINRYRPDRVFFDGLGRTAVSSSLTSAGLVNVSYGYNQLGLPKTESVPYVTSEQEGFFYYYDVLGRLTMKVVPGGYYSVASFGLNRGPEGRVYKRTTSSMFRGDAVVRSHLLYDSLDRLVKVAQCTTSQCDDPFSGADDIEITSYEYNFRGDILRVCMADGNGRCEDPTTSKSVYFYDGLGRVAASKDPDLNVCADTDLSNYGSGCATRHYYDGVGNRVAATDAKYNLPQVDGYKTEMIYDERDRVVRQDVYVRNEGSDGHTTIGQSQSSHLLYDLADGNCPLAQSGLVGRLSSERVRKTNATEDLSYRCFGYDTIGRVTEMYVKLVVPGSESVSAEFSYQYNNNGSVREMRIQPQVLQANCR